MSIYRIWVELTEQIFRKQPIEQLPENVFLTWVRHLPYAAAELLLLHRNRDGSVGIFLEYRDDGQFKGWAPTGSVLLPGQTVAQKLELIRINELHGVQVTDTECICLTAIQRPSAMRRNGIGLIFVGWINDENAHRLIQKTGGRFFIITARTDETIIHQEYWQMVLEFLAEEKFRESAAAAGINVPPKRTLLHTVDLIR